MEENLKKTAEEYVKFLVGTGNKNEKRKIVVRAIMDDQLKFLVTCKERWGNKFYSEIVADC